MTTKSRAIPEGFLTVGELAKKMRTTVRTLQHYDRIGLLIPAGESAGGRRLYDAADVVRLGQILALKHLGFSLEEIRDRLINLDSPADVAEALESQAAAVQEQIETLTKAVADLRTLREETLRMDRVDFARYADLVMLLKEGNDNLWVMRVVGDKMRDRIHELDNETAKRIWADMLRITAAASELHRQGADPTAPEGQRLAEEMWQTALAFSGGDPAVLAEMEDLDRNVEKWEGDLASAYTAEAQAFMNAAMEVWAQRNGYPFAG